MEVDNNTGGGVGVTLPEDVIFQILSWVPVKHLVRCRCVCKQWRALISEPVFIATHKARAAPLLVASFDAPGTGRYGPRGRRPELRVMDTDGNVLRVIKIGASLNLSPARLDLVCLNDPGLGARAIDPVTGRVVVTVTRTRPPASFGPSSFSRFGRAVPSDAYKLVRVLQTQQDRGVEVATVGVVDPEELRWRRRPPVPDLGAACSCTDCSVAVDGVIYFLSRATHYGHDHEAGWNRIARFDLESEDWKTTLHGPEQLGQKQPWERLHVALGELKGTLSVLQTVRNQSQHPYTRMNLWLLADSERSVWVKRYTVESPGTSYRARALDVLHDGRLLLLKTIHTERTVLVQDRLIVLSGEKRIVLQLYDSHTGTFADVMVMPKEFKGSFTLSTGTLLS